LLRKKRRNKTKTGETRQKQEKQDKNRRNKTKTGETSISICDSISTTI